MLNDRTPKLTEATALSHGEHMGDDMAGLVLGITRPAHARRGDGRAERPSVANRLRLVAEKTGDSYGPEPTLGTRCAAAATPRRHLPVPGPIMTVTRGQRTQVRS